MTTITTKRHKLKFYLSIVFSFLFFCGFGTFMIWIFISGLNRGEFVEAKYYFMPVFGLLFYIMAFYTIVKYFRNVPIISIDKDLIKFGSAEIYNLTDIQNVVLTGKKPFKFIFKYPMEGTEILLKNGTTKYFFDDMYSNAWELKLFLEQVVIKKKDFAYIENYRIDPSELRYEQISYFKGNQFTSLRGFSCWGIIVFFIYLMISRDKIPPVGALILIGSIGTVLFVFNSWLMNFFGLSEEYFIIKNHNFIWKENIYRLTDIKEVIFETRVKMPNCLRIVTKDYRNKLYPAATLRDKTWLELKRVLEKEGIKVRNECIYHC
jgi:hypothetical protein